MNHDKPLLSPKRLAYAVAWWCWYVIQCEKDGKEPHVPLWTVVRTYRRPIAADKKGLY